MDANTVNRGGKWTSKGFVFELTGGNPALDFVNTLDMRPLPSRTELLATYADACSWARQVGLITAKEESERKKAAAQRPAEAKAARRRFVEARECLFGVFSALAVDERIPEETLELLNQLVHRASAHFELEPRKGGFAWRNAADPRELDSFLWPVVHAAVMLLTGPDVSRIRRCASEKCDWMFLDRSKRGNRRWCDMAVCGNRAKAQRFYERKKKGVVTK